MPRAAGGLPVQSSSPKVTDRSAAGSSPAMARKSVVLPLPLGPDSTVMPAVGIVSAAFNSNPG